LIAWAIERAYFRSRHAAAGLNRGAGEHRELRRLVTSALDLFLKQPIPNRFRIAEDDLDEFAFVVGLASFLGRSSWSLLLGLSLLLLLLLQQLLAELRVNKNADADDQHHQDAAATDGIAGVMPGRFSTF
jgi:hypothetical protein